MYCIDYCEFRFSFIKQMLSGVWFLCCRDSLDRQIWISTELHHLQPNLWQSGARCHLPDRCADFSWRTPQRHHITQYRRCMFSFSLLSIVTSVFYILQGILKLLKCLKYYVKQYTNFVVCDIYTQIYMKIQHVQIQDSRICGNKMFLCLILSYLKIFEDFNVKSIQDFVMLFQD